jgi:hypothetical protein
MKAEIMIDGESLDINDFVEKLTFEITSGLVRSLHDVPDWSKVKIVIEK